MTKETIHLAVYDTMADWEVGYVVAHLNSPDFQKNPAGFRSKQLVFPLIRSSPKAGCGSFPTSV